MGQSLFKKHSKFIISMKYFTTAWPDSGRHYLDVFTQGHKKHFKRRKYGTESV